MTIISLSLEEIERLVRDAFESAGCDRENVAALVRTVVTAERDGSHSHGLFRIPGYLASLRNGKVKGTASPTVERRTPSFVAVDGDGGFSPVAIERGIPQLAAAARECGVAAMAITDTYHFAALWPETEALAEQDLVGIACTSSTAVVAPAGGRHALFGTNPLSFAWPRPGKSPFVFDMATSAMAQGDLQIAARDGRPVAEGVGLGADGKPTQDPVAILQGVLLPFGGYKGSAIAMMVELLAGGLLNEQFSFEALRDDNKDGGPARGGELVIALSPEWLAGTGWASRCEQFFSKAEAMDGLRMPGARRHSSRRDTGPRDVNRELYDEIRRLTQ